MKSVASWHPFRSLLRRDEPFDDLMRDVLRFGAPADGLLEPAADIAEADDEVTVKLEIPGVDKKDLHVSVSDDTVTVRGETRKETEEKKKSFHRREIRYGSFERSIGLPAEVDPAKAGAKLENGMLTITLPKATQAKRKRIDVAIA